MATFAARLAQNLLQVTSPVLGAHVLGLPPRLIGAGVALAGLTTVTGTATLAIRGRTRHAARLVGGGLVTLTAASLAFGLGDGLASYLCACVLAGCGAALVFPGLVGLVVSASPAARSSALSRYTAALSSALLVGPIVQAGVIVGLGGSLRGAMLSLVPWFVVASACVGWARRRLCPEDPDVGQPSGRVQRIQSAIATVVSARDLRLAIWQQTTFEAVFVTVVAFGAIAAKRLEGLSFSSVLWLFGVLFGISLVIRSAFSLRFPHRWSVRLARAGVVVDAVCVVLLAMGTRPSFVAAMILVGVGHGVSYPVSLSLVAEGAALDDVLARNSLLATALGLVAAVVPAGVGVAADAMGYRAAFGLVGAPVALLGVLVWLDSARGDADHGASVPNHRRGAIHSEESRRGGPVGGGGRFSPGGVP